MLRCVSAARAPKGSRRIASAGTSYRRRTPVSRGSRTALTRVSAEASQCPSDHPVSVAPEAVPADPSTVPAKKAGTYVPSYLLHIQRHGASRTLSCTDERAQKQEIAEDEAEERRERVAVPWYAQKLSEYSVMARQRQRERAAQEASADGTQNSPPPTVDSLPHCAACTASLCNSADGVAEAEPLSVGGSQLPTSVLLAMWWSQQQQTRQRVFASAREPSEVTAAATALAAAATHTETVIHTLTGDWSAHDGAFLAVPAHTKEVSAMPAEKTADAGVQTAETNSTGQRSARAMKEDKKKKKGKSRTASATGSRAEEGEASSPGAGKQNSGRAAVCDKGAPASTQARRPRRKAQCGDAASDSQDPAVRACAPHATPHPPPPPEPFPPAAVSAVAGTAARMPAPPSVWTTPLAAGLHTLFSAAAGTGAGAAAAACSATPADTARAQSAHAAVSAVRGERDDEDATDLPYQTVLSLSHYYVASLSFSSPRTRAGVADGTAEDRKGKEGRAFTAAAPFWLPVRLLPYLPHFPLSDALAAMHLPPSLIADRPTVNPFGTDERDGYVQQTLTDGVLGRLAQPPGPTVHSQNPSRHPQACVSTFSRPFDELTTAVQPTDTELPAPILLSLPKNILSRVLYHWSSLWSRHATLALRPAVGHLLPLSSFPYLETVSRERLRTKHVQAVHHLVLAASAAKSGRFTTNDAAAEPSAPREPDTARTSKILRHATVVACAGQRFVNSADTILAGLVDSDLCARNAVPLDETGMVFYAAIPLVRQRLQANLHDGAPLLQHVAAHWKRYGTLDGATEAWLRSERATSAATSYGAGSVPLVRSQTVDTGSSLCAREPARELTADSATGEFAGAAESVGATPYAERLRRCTRRQAVADVVTLAAVRRNARQFLFRSPYWIDTATMEERWGLTPLPLAEPLVVRGRRYVNAEQTLDAARFNAATCTPKRTHEVVTSDGLLRCTWALSETLRDLQLRHEQCKGDDRDTVDAVQESPTLGPWPSVLRTADPNSPAATLSKNSSPRRRPVTDAAEDQGDLRSSTVPAGSANAATSADANVSAVERLFGKTATWIHNEAEAIHRLPNLWVQQELIQRLSWRVRPRPLLALLPTAALLHSGAPITAEHREREPLREASDGPDKSFPTLVRGHDKSPTFTPGECPDGVLRDDARRTIACVCAADLLDLPALARVLAYQPRIFYNSTGPTLTDADDDYVQWEQALAATADNSQRLPDVVLAQADVLVQAANDVFRRAMTAKKRALRRRLVLPQRSRLTLALLAVERSYSEEHDADVWVSKEILDTEPWLVPANRRTTPLPSAEVEVIESDPLPSARDGELSFSEKYPPDSHWDSKKTPCVRKLTLVHRDELAWPCNTGEHTFPPYWLSAKL